MHDLEFDHIHPSEEQKEQLSDAIWSADNVEFTTVGVDVGSSTSHLMFAKVHLQRLAEALSSRFVVVSREILWKSPILLTPYRPDFTIDAEELGAFIDAAYGQAGITKNDIDSGAVILTGEALKRTNARAIADLFAMESGKFVCASAGHNMEALMAAHGSGAVELSRQEHRTFLNVDIGGGTTKFALVHGGRLLHSSAIAVGGRLVAMDEDGDLNRIEEPALLMAKAAGIDLVLGQKLTDEARAKLVTTMIEILRNAIARKPLGAEFNDLILTPSLPADIKIDAITFSGGVSEFIFKRETADHGDIGRDMANALVEALENNEIEYPVYDPGQGIRATVVGASQFTVQVSGNTIHITRPEALPVRNVPVVRIEAALDGDIDPDVISGAIATSLARIDITEGETTTALAFTWEGEPAYPRLFALAKGICGGFANTVAEAKPLILVMEGDIGKSLGVILKTELDVTGDIISLDGVQLREFDFIDVGELIQPTDVAPLIIKSLLFGSDRGQSQDHGHSHHHDHHSHD
ncbi:MAG: reactivating factor for ethanolamine ammonia lyase [Rhodospirillaceae bacterium]|jgi:ethanolamine utilization protein EutA|nr:reactivating factor for ethanolamine ammonia lyase [Rhodospirillaceae bacterium]MBT3886820.1 reactivating factor for ethanolamine ammonia lyase [Rhodospirillaceae bacterium]MBT4671382.1 reactivating factor for ethanolamine ammonia lyase [Rhodospirillaceae bacterium]MBT4750801.1 reactivating factor for ethanolamine ammonia lyase [Rhodospirillaceae bacterium]MBT5180753.1 reactivating factor for ethanolamine ammonia lyase [Rhodospirillaceae bacterium]